MKIARIYAALVFSGLALLNFTTTGAAQSTNWGEGAKGTGTPSGSAEALSPDPRDVSGLGKKTSPEREERDATDGLPAPIERTPGAEKKRGFPDDVLPGDSSHTVVKTPAAHGK